MMRYIFTLFLLAVSPPATADCPGPGSGTIHWIVPSKPGGGYDAYSRLLQPFLEQSLQTRILMVNRFEAGGIVGAMTIRDAVPDGRTLGIINAPGLLAAHLAGNAPVPHPGSDFTIIARVAMTHVVMLTGRDSGFSNMDELMRSARSRPVLAGVRDAGSSNFIALPVVASLIGMNFELVTGYVGNAARTMAALRGEIDIVLHNFDSARRYIESGELVPLLQVADPGARDLDSDARQLLAGVPVLGGDAGYAVSRVGDTGKTIALVKREAAALANIYAAGGLVVAPRNLPETAFTCLSTALENILNSDVLIDAAGRARLSIEYQAPGAIVDDLATAMRELKQFKPLIMSAIEQARQ